MTLPTWSSSLGACVTRADLEAGRLQRGLRRGLVLVEDAGHGDLLDGGLLGSRLSSTAATTPPISSTAATAATIAMIRRLRRRRVVLVVPVLLAVVVPAGGRREDGGLLGVAHDRRRLDPLAGQCPEQVGAHLARPTGTGWPGSCSSP